MTTNKSIKCFSFNIIFLLLLMSNFTVIFSLMFYRYHYGKPNCHNNDLYTIDYNLKVTQALVMNYCCCTEICLLTNLFSISCNFLHAQKVNLIGVLHLMNQQMSCHQFDNTAKLYD